MLNEKEKQKIYKLGCKFVINKYEKVRKNLLNTIYDKDDLKQEAYIIFQRELKNTIVPKGEKFSPSQMQYLTFLKWYQTCLGNFIADLIDHSNVKTKYFQNPKDETLEEEQRNIEISYDPFSTEQKFNIEDIFRKLDAKEAKILKMYIIEKMTQYEISQVLDMRQCTVSRTLKKALAKSQNMLNLF